ncbi:MAG: hypothetical protein ACLUNQ_05455 [Oscillospiraceae bacterium]
MCRPRTLTAPFSTLIALDSHNYPTMGDVTREKLIQVILDAQLNDGGWNLSAENADTGYDRYGHSGPGTLLQDQRDREGRCG